MTNKIVKKTKLIVVAAAIVIALFCYWFITGQVSFYDKSCASDDDCVVFGETGDCNCGCFNKNTQWVSGGDCFCLAPTSCICVNGKCEDVFQE